MIIPNYITSFRVPEDFYKTRISKNMIIYIINMMITYNLRVEPPVTRKAPPQTRTSAINASGSSNYAFAKCPDITAGVWLLDVLSGVQGLNICFSVTH